MNFYILTIYLPISSSIYFSRHGFTMIFTMQILFCGIFKPINSTIVPIKDYSFLRFQVRIAMGCACVGWTTLFLQHNIKCNKILIKFLKFSWAAGVYLRSFGVFPSFSLTLLLSYSGYSWYS